MSTAWGPLLECVFALADLQALPARLTDVDDFGDAQGNPLPPSVFAKGCRDRARWEGVGWGVLGIMHAGVGWAGVFCLFFRWGGVLFCFWVVSEGLGCLKSGFRG